MLTILHIITDLNRGGAETVLYRLLLNIPVESNEKHIVVSLRDKGFYGDKLELINVPVYVLKMEKIWSFPRAFFQLVKLMRNLRPDVVQTWLYHADLLGGGGAKFCGKPPVIWGIHTVDLDSNASFLTKVVRHLCAFTSRWLPSAILCVARSSFESHVALGYKRDKMRIVPNGFDLPNIEDFQADAFALRCSIGLDGHHQVIGSVGRFHPDKDYRNFLASASLLKKKYKDVRFVLVGKSLSPLNEMLMSWIRDYDLENVVVLLGERDDITTCLLAMDIFCLSSKTEAFPLVVGEAMAAGRPVVVTDVGDVAFLVGETGIVVPSESPKSLCEGLSCMLEYPINKRLELGVFSRRRINSNFSMHEMISKIRQTYQVLVDKNQ